METNEFCIQTNGAIFLEYRFKYLNFLLIIYIFRIFLFEFNKNIMATPSSKKEEIPISTCMKRQFKKMLDAELKVLREDTLYPLYIHQLLQETLKLILPGMKGNTLTTQTERDAFFRALNNYNVPKSAIPTALTPDSQRKIIMYKDKNLRSVIAQPDIFANKNVLKNSISNVKSKEEQDLYFKMADYIKIKFN